ncbi:hypothetical protein [Roseimicrobium sp. ORNL1]|uniref:hypothetical protein n=1 Tax=Roseimicrobium sp. ORNL1 TaxID=2711231 RepID=UPI00197E81DF|nr:hypothetical protein [Roseimicrobium sp. ORNL1]
MSITSYCIEQENGGRIPGCRHWTDRQMLQLCGLMREDLAGACGLWSWDGDDLVVADYPLEQEQTWQAKREAGRKGGASTSEAKVAAGQENGRKGGRPRKDASTLPSSRNPNKTQAETQRKGMGKEEKEEGNKRKRNEKEDPASSSPPSECEGAESLVLNDDDDASSSSSEREHRSPGDPRFHSITQRCGDTFHAALGMEYSFQGGKDGSALKRFLENNGNVSAEDFLNVWTQALRRTREDPYARHCSQAGSIHGLCTRWNDVRLELQRPATAKKSTHEERFQRSGEIPTDVSMAKVRIYRLSDADE